MKLRTLLNWIAKVVKALWLFLAGVLSVVIIYYLLTGVEQGIDVVIQSGELLDSGMLSIFAVFLWSFLVWYSCRTLSYIKQKKDDEIFSKKSPDDTLSAALYKKNCIPSGLYQHIPRMLAYNCFVSVQVAIFHLPTFFAWSGFVMILIIGAHNVLYFLVTAWIQRESHHAKNKIHGFITRTFIAGYCTFIAFQILEAGQGIDLLAHPLRHKFWLSIIAMLMFVLQITIVFLFILRRRIIDERKKDLTLKPSRILAWIGFNPAYNAAEVPYFNLLNGFAAVAIVIYLSAIFIMPFADVMGPMAFTLLALGILAGFSNLLTLISIRISFNVMIILLVMAFLFGQYRDPYPIRFIESGSTVNFGARPDINTYLTKWFSRRLPLLNSADSTKNFPVYLVLSNGGASRAGKWTSSVLSTLQDTSYRSDTPKDNFKEHILCIAGASGGAVGNSAFYSLLKASHEKTLSPNDFARHTDSFFETDFLTYTLGRLLGPDIFKHLIPFNIPVDNRADALENVLSEGSEDELLNTFFKKPLTEVLDTTGALPILLINTTQVDNGMPGVISSVLLPEHSQRVDVLSLVDSMGVHSGKGNLTLSTAAVLSSRFPYVSPAGKIFDRYYVDGGYFDNSGAGAVLEFIQELNRFLEDTLQKDIIKFRKRFTFHLLHITNSEILTRPEKDIHPLTNDLLTPVLTLAGMQGASTSIGNGMLIDAFKQFNSDTANALIVYSLYDELWPDPAKTAGEYEEGYPMSWVISHYQLHRMQTALKRAHRKNIRKFNF